MSAVEEAISALRAGEAVVVPTDTVYGVAVLPSVEGAIGRLFWVKGRPRERAIPILAATRGDLEEVAVFDRRARILADEFWPGPLTLVLARVEGFGVDLGGPDDGTVAVRVPDHKVVHDLLSETGPLAITSANRSGEPAATTADAARAALGERVSVYVDSGATEGTGSTVVSLAGGDPECLREGDLSYEEVLRALS